MTDYREFHAPQGKLIFQPGQTCPSFILLSEGTIKVTLTSASGREVVLYRVQPGDICLQTLTCLIIDQPYNAEGIAETALSGQMVPAADFRAALARDEDFCYKLMASIATRFAEYQRLVEDVALTSFDARLARTLLASPDGKVACTHSELATETASGREYVTRRLSEFADRGLVEQKRTA